MNRILKPSATFAVPPASGRTELVGFNVGPGGELYFVSALRTLDYQTVGDGFAIFPKTTPDSPQQYQVQCLENDRVTLDLLVKDERFNLHDIQPIDDELLLVCCRSKRRSATDFERNGRIYGRDGIFRREILLGDGVATVQSTRGGQVWASYFDEGIFGNFGWREPVGASGLVAWDKDGKQLYEFEAPAGFDTMADCYALNVAADDDVWCYYYSEFPLVRIQNHAVTSAWRTPVSGSGAFAIAGGYALFAGGYDQREELILVRLEPNESSSVVGTFRIVGGNGEQLSVERVVGRGSNLYVMAGDAVHVVDAGAAIAQIDT